MFLEITDASVRYASQSPSSATPRGASRPAVDRVSLGMAPGEIGVLIGPSGCGKTSLLRAVAGLEPLAGGCIAIDGDVLSDADGRRHVAPEARRIGMVFQDYALFPHLDVAANIAFGIRHLPAPQRRERVQAVLELVGLQHAGARAPHQLSGGQQQRVALARALAPGPRLMLLDEPFSSLDADLRERLAQELRTILKGAGTTALFVTHDQLEAFAVGDRIGVMQAGRLEQWDAPHALYHRPASRFVAGFIGDSVFTRARLLPGGRDGGPRLRTALGDLDPPAGAPLPPPAADGGLDLLLRADDVVHDDAAPLKARVERKAFHGASYLYTLRLAGGEQVLAHVPSHHDHAVGEWIGIRAELDHLVAFPPESPESPPAPVFPEPPPAAATEPGTVR